MVPPGRRVSFGAIRLLLQTCHATHRQSDENRRRLRFTKLRRQPARPSGSRPFRPLRPACHRQQVFSNRLGDKRHRRRLRPKLHPLRPLHGRLQHGRKISITTFLSKLIYYWL